MQRQNKTSVKDLKSFSDVRARADQYSSSNETNKLVKRAILQELNSHLISIKPQILHKKEEDDPTGRRKNTTGKKRKTVEPRTTSRGKSFRSVEISLF